MLNLGDTFFECFARKMEKVMADIKENQMTEISTPTYLRCTDSNGNSKIVTPENALKAAGAPAGYLRKSLSGGQWYRIAVSKEPNNAIASALINIGNSYGTIASASCLFYVAASGYRDVVVAKIANLEHYVSKVRLLTKVSTTAKLMLDILVRNTSGSNSNFAHISYSCNIGFNFQDPEEVADTPEEGYTVSEFSLT